MQKGNLTRKMIEDSGMCNVSVLTEDVPFETIRRFGMQSGADVDKFDGFTSVKRSHNGVVYITENTAAMFSCTIKEKLDLGSHMLFIGEITESKVLSNQNVCTYAHYHKAIKPKF